MIPVQRSRNQVNGGIAINRLGHDARARHNSLGYKNVDWNEADSKLEDREQLGAGDCTVSWPYFLPLWFLSGGQVKPLGLTPEDRQR
jgi:hypothetical protein